MTHNYEGNAGIPLYAMRFYRKALRDIVGPMERHSDYIHHFKLTKFDDYMALLKMLRDDPINLMEYGEFAEYKVPGSLAQKVDKFKAKMRDKREKERTQSVE